MSGQLLVILDSNELSLDGNQLVLNLYGRIGSWSSNETYALIAELISYYNDAKYITRSKKLVRTKMLLTKNMRMICKRNINYLVLCSLWLILNACEDSKNGRSSDSEPDMNTLSAGQSNSTDMISETPAGESSSGTEVETAGQAAGGEIELAGTEVAGTEVSEAAGTEIAGTELAGVEMRMPSCLISCAEFVECAIKQCPGYDEDDDTLLMEECLGLCNPNLAVLFDRLVGCPEKIRFASTVRTDFLNFCDSESEGFCETYIATCGEWLGQNECEPHYNDAPRSGESYTNGAHQQCYEYHLGSAMRALEDGDEAGVQRGCERAAGLAICVNEAQP